MTGSAAPAFRPRFFLLFLVVFLLALPASWARAEKRVVTVGVYENAPKIFTVNGKPTGILIDVIEDVAQDEGWALRDASPLKPNCQALQGWVSDRMPVAGWK